MKQYLEINTLNNNINVIAVGDDVTVEDTDFVKYRELAEGASTLAIRYGVNQAGEVVDVCPGKTDEEVLALLQYVTEGDGLDIEVVRKDKLFEIRTYFNNLIEGLKADAADYEVSTWEIQQLEYSAWARDNQTLTPYLSVMASARGIELAVLMQKVGYKVAGMATIQGKQHALEDALKACTTVDEIKAIEVKM